MYSVYSFTANYYDIELRFYIIILPYMNYTTLNRNHFQVGIKS